VIRLLALSLLLVTVLACGKPAPHLHEASAASLQQGWTNLASADGSVSVGIPQTFHDALVMQAPGSGLSIDQTPAPPDPDEPAGATPTPQTTDARADSAEKRFLGDLNNMSAAMEQSMHQQIVDDMTKHGYVVWAWLNGKQAIAERRTEISVKKIPDAKAGNLDSAAEAAREGMSGDVTMEKVTLPIGEAEKISSDFQDRIGDQETEIKYILLDGDDEYILRLYALNGPEQIQPLANDVALSLRIKPKA
jgi:hypothetical protein